MSQAKKIREERAAVLAWLRDTFVEMPSATVCREEAFEAYRQDCFRRGSHPTNNAAFGKLIKKTFPSVEPTRLGKRRQNKMHHLNLAWRRNLDEDLLRQLDQESPLKQEEPHTEEEKRGPARGSKRQRRLHWVKVEGSATHKKRSEPASPTTDPLDQEDDEVAVKEEPRYDQEAEDELEDEADQDYAEAEEEYNPDKTDHDPEEEEPEEEEYDDDDEERSTRRRQKVEMRRRLNETEMFSPESSVPQPQNDGNMAFMYLMKRYRHVLLPLQPRTMKKRTHASNGTELAGLMPLNALCFKKKTISYFLSDEHGRQEVCSLKLCTLTMISFSSFLLGDQTISKEYYMMARNQFDNLLDRFDRDVASCMLPLSWLSQLYSLHEEDHKFLLSTGIQVCEAIGATNDVVYHSLLRRMTLYEMYQPVKRDLVKEEQLDNKLRMVYDEMCDIWCTVQHLHILVSHLITMTSDMQAELQHHMDEIRRVEQIALNSGNNDVNPSVISNLIVCAALGLRAVVGTMLGAHAEEADAARNMVLGLLKLDQPSLIFNLLHLLPNNSMMLRTVVSIMAKHQETNLLRLLLDAIEVAKERYPWMNSIHNFITEQYLEAICITPASTTPFRPNDNPPPPGSSQPPSGSTLPPPSWGFNFFSLSALGLPRRPQFDPDLQCRLGEGSACVPDPCAFASYSCTSSAVPLHRSYEFELPTFTAATSEAVGFDPSLIMTMTPITFRDSPDHPRLPSWHVGDVMSSPQPGDDSETVVPPPCSLSVSSIVDVCSFLA